MTPLDRLQERPYNYFRETTRSGCPGKRNFLQGKTLQSQWPELLDAFPPVEHVSAVPAPRGVGNFRPWGNPPRPRRPEPPVFFFKGLGDRP